MTDDRYEPREREPTLNEILDLAMRRMAAALVIAGGVIALAIYARPGPPRFDAIATPTGIVRIDTRNGKMIACEGGRCMTVLERHQRLAPNPNVLKKSEPKPALPAPRQ
jgi:hypothetical protein